MHGGPVQINQEILMHSGPEHVKTRNNDAQWASTGKIKRYECTVGQYRLKLEIIMHNGPVKTRNIWPVLIFITNSDLYC